MLAARIGQLLNFSNISNELGVSIPTLQQWFSLLESSFITFKLTPFLKNYNKRINKTGKAYFYDTGLACSLLNIRSEEELAVHPLRGSLFERIGLSSKLPSSFIIKESVPIFFSGETEAVTKWICW
jgi:predicted AAA+ superfamily ATPase